MYIKVHESYRKVVAFCDSEIVGKKFEEGKRQLDVTENFYKGDEVGHEEAIELLKDYALDDSTFNIVGHEAVKTAIEAGLINKNSVGKVGGIPFALVLL